MEGKRDRFVRLVHFSGFVMAFFEALSFGES